MEDHIKSVSSCDLYVAIYVCYCTATYFSGSSGDVFPNLSPGSHTMNVRFTPDGYCQALTEELSLSFTVFMRSKSSN